MPKARQFTVPCENRPGTLAHIAKVLGDAKVKGARKASVVLSVSDLGAAVRV